jgi:hypothetical protein
VNYLIDESFVYPQVVSEYDDLGTVTTAQTIGVETIGVKTIVKTIENDRGQVSTFI